MERTAEKMDASLEIRPFRNTDRQAVTRLWRECGLVTPWNSPEADIDRKMRVDPELFLVGVLEKTIAATAMGGYEGHRGWINYLAVSPSLQGKGIGGKLVIRLEQLLVERGCPKINLQVRAGNKDVIHFYQSLGYKVDDVISMGKRLVNDDQ